MKLLFYSETPISGMPWRTSTVINRHMEDGWCRAVTKHSSYGTRSFPYDVNELEDFALELFCEADVVIIPANHAEEDLPHVTEAPIVTHYNIPPKYWLNRSPSKENAHCSGFYHHRFVPDLKPLPSGMPLDDEFFKPGDKPNDRVVIAYTPVTREEFGWSSKGWPQTLGVLKKIKKQYGNDVEIVVIEKSSYEDSMRAKRHAHIVIDECVTGSYHNCSLEAMACGAVAIAFTDAKQMATTVDLLDGNDELARELPITSAPISQLETNLCMLIENRDLLKILMQESRGWMERAYSETWQAKKWLDWHREFLLSLESKQKQSLKA